MSAMFHSSDDANVYRSNVAFVYSDENTRAVMTMLDAQPGEIILDVGCGTGELSIRIHEIVTSKADSPGRVIGIDKSESMIEAARNSAPWKKAQCADDTSSTATLQFHVCDAQNLTEWLERHNLVGSFDKVFSNAALHWMKDDPQKVANAMRLALKPAKNGSKGGTLAIEMGGFMNAIGVRSALHAALQRRGINARQIDPWVFPTNHNYERILQRAGLSNVQTLHVIRPTPLSHGREGLRRWLEAFGGSFFEALPNAKERATMLGEIEEQLEVDLYDVERQQWTIMYTRLRASAQNA